MKRILAAAIAAFMVAGSQGAIFASQVPTDVSGTPYEDAVTNLARKGIITGNDDGTFRPASPINRAEACVIIAKAAEVSQAALTAAPSKGFTDLDGYGWAENYINYCASIGAVSGYPDNTFHPGSHVTYAEMAAMLINATGADQSELTGSWPDNYMNKALEMGLLEHIILSGVLDPDAAATRGNVAIMTNICDHDIAIQAQASSIVTESSYLRLQNNMLQAAVDMSKLEFSQDNASDAIVAAEHLISACSSLIDADPPAKYQQEHPSYVQAAAIYIKAAESIKAIYQSTAEMDDAARQTAYDQYSSYMKDAVSIISSI